VNTHGFVTLALFLGVLLGLAVPLGRFMARVYQGERTLLARPFGPLERGLLRLAGVDAKAEMTWKEYALAVLAFNCAGMLAVYLLQRVQGSLLLNPAGLPAVPPDVAFNTAASFASNTNWQAYGGESTMSHLTQMAALTVQNFVSAATGMAVLVAFIRGFVRENGTGIGNFWVDLTRGTVYILLPLSVVFALFLVSQGVVQTFMGSTHVTLVEPLVGADNEPVRDQVLALGHHALGRIQALALDEHHRVVRPDRGLEQALRVRSR
jgi:K+-transporting ATPase ATPase A chain